MSTASPLPADQPLYDLVSGAAAETIADVVARMEAIDALLPANDGLKWFNRLYLMVTQKIDLLTAADWQDPAWLTRLDVVFAGLYFSAIAGFLGGSGTVPSSAVPSSAVPSSWSALFEARYRSGIDRIQFALAGMNAHINHDLALALIATDAEFNLVPALDSAEHADYQSVNGLLKTLMPATLTMLATDTLGVLAEDTGMVGRLLAFWDICRARDLAWDFANHLRVLTGLNRDAALVAQDALTGALGRAILAMI